MFKNNQLNKLSSLIRFEIIKKTFQRQSGHLGGALSCTDLLVNIFNNFIFKKKKSKFILSKGHCALALYSTLFVSKKLSKAQFNKFASQGSIFGEHPSPKIKNKYIEFSTGSLGHGLSFGSGLAYSKYIKKEVGYVFVLMSDGEMNCGSVWEAALLSSKLKLNNLIAIIDYNKYQATGKSDEILNIKPLSKKWRSFGWHAIECDGNKHNSISKKINLLLKQKSKKPKVLIAHTIKGKGVDFMENDNNWHYRSPNIHEVKKSKIQLGIK